MCHGDPFFFTDPCVTAILTSLLILVSRQSLLRYLSMCRGNPYFVTHPCVAATLTSLLIHVSRQSKNKLKTQTLNRVWIIQYKRKPLRSRAPSERPLCLAPTHSNKSSLTKGNPRANRKKGMISQRKKTRTSTARQGPKKLLDKEDHRSQKLKLCRRRHV
jgi:hypothetical protein